MSFSIEKWLYYSCKDLRVQQFLALISCSLWIIASKRISMEALNFHTNCRITDFRGNASRRWHDQQSHMRHQVSKAWQRNRCIKGGIGVRKTQKFKDSLRSQG